MFWLSIQYLNRCVAASDSEVLEAPGAIVPFSIKRILVDLEKGCYVRLIFQTSLVDLIVRVHYEEHLTFLYLWDGENSRFTTEGAFLSTLYSHIL